MKEKYVKAHMRAAQVYAELSTAERLHVGCVIVKDNTIIGIGYNGMPSGNAVQINSTKSIDGARSVSPLMMAKNDGTVAACSRMIESHPNVSADVCPNFSVTNVLNFSKSTLNFSMIIY